MGVFLAWLLFSVLVGVMATNRGRSGFGWFCLAVVISPLFAGLLVLVLKSHATEAAVQTGEMRICPQCAEAIRREAIKCRYCGSQLEPDSVPSADELAQRRYGG